MTQLSFSSLLSDPESDDQFQMHFEPGFPIGSIEEGDYFFEDYYCQKPDCDCQRVTLVVVDEEGEEHAVITYGWQPRSFYLDPGDGVIAEFDEEFADLITEGHLDPLDFQSENAPFFLSCFIEYFRDDPLFQDWLKRRYRLFKEAVAREEPLELEDKTIIPFPKIRTQR
jgi:hypothetical protein